MVNRDFLLKKIPKVEDKLLLSKILDKALKAENSMSTTHSNFLDPYQIALVTKVLSEFNDVDFTFDGGYEGAERSIVIFRPKFMPFEDYINVDREKYFKVINIRLNKKNSFSHRDYLGSLMGLGIKREKIGDILVYDNFCDVIVLEEVADYIKYNLTMVGSARVEVEIKRIGELKAPEPKVKEISTTVASLRVDCVASAGFGISRSKAADLIKAEKLNLNWEMVNNLARQVNEGDTISIRGMGKIVLNRINGRTKKDRISVLIKKFV